MRIPVRQEALDRLIAEYLPARAVADGASAARKSTSSDADVLAHAKSERFDKLQRGDWQGDYGSQSEADLALCNLYAAAGADAEQIDRLFRSSGLMRGKWERRDYRDATLAKALRDHTNDSEPTSRHPSGLLVQKADLTRSKPPEWAWQDRIVLSGLNLLLGDEGIGKGTLSAWLLARLTRGELPGAFEGTPVNVAIIGDEDSFNDVWTPRLHVAGADLDRVSIIERPDGSLVELQADRSKLARAVDIGQMKVVYLDALIDNLGDADDWRGKQVRAALAPARAIARQYNVAVVGSMHPNKHGANFRQLVAGSTAFNAVSRSSLLLAKHPHRIDRVVLVRGKGNLARTPKAVEFDIVDQQLEANGYTFKLPLATNFDESRLTVETLLDLLKPKAVAGARRVSGRDLIAETLADGEWHSARTIIAACEDAGIDVRTAQRAADDLGVEKDKRGFPAESFWRLGALDL